LVCRWNSSECEVRTRQIPLQSSRTRTASDERERIYARRGGRTGTTCARDARWCLDRATVRLSRSTALAKLGCGGGWRGWCKSLERRWEVSIDVWFRLLLKYEVLMIYGRGSEQPDNPMGWMKQDSEDQNGKNRGSTRVQRGTLNNNREGANREGAGKYIGCPQWLSAGIRRTAAHAQPAVKVRMTWRFR
jgi:hypothetical protein